MFILCDTIENGNKKIANTHFVQSFNIKSLFDTQTICFSLCSMCVRHTDIYTRDKNGNFFDFFIVITVKFQIFPESSRNEIKWNFWLASTHQMLKENYTKLSESQFFSRVYQPMLFYWQMFLRSSYKSSRVVFIAAGSGWIADNL